MKRVNRLGIIAVLAVGTVLAPAYAGTVTVGRFYTELAQAKHLVSVDAASAEANLRGAGINLPKLALNKSLTEGDMTAISNALGVAVTTQRPSEPVSESQMNTFMASFGSQLSAPAVRGGTPYQTLSTDGDPGNSGNGKGLKKGHHKSTSEPG
jgi:uncharacterized membrane protein (DUF441 family)